MNWRRCGRRPAQAQVVSTSVPDPDWSILLDEALAEIFQRLPLPERLQVVPMVCKNWKKVACDPTSWRVIDMVPWIQQKMDAECMWEYDCEPVVDRLVKILVDRSRGLLRELRTMYVSDDAIEYMADRCPLLEVLTMQSSLGVTNKSALKLATMSPKLRHLDVSDCYNISKQALMAFGDNCPSLEWLGRNMVNQNATNHAFESTSSPPGGDEEAITMSKHYPRLKHLEMKKTCISDRGLRHLAIGCRNLQSLNVACCYVLSPKALDDVSKNCTNLREFTKPITPRMHISPNDFQATMLFE
ncbi:hypothetical protein Mapa_007103 [Marchantia paleacea]|nr:hypothetical protein Mapa_007103 [Marchantia paleacea]